MPSAVSDSSVLIHLSAIGQFALLPLFFSEVRVPDAVWREVVVQGRSHQVVQDVQEAAKQGWLKVATPANAPLMQTLRQDLHDGEAEAIALAVETAPDFLLMDESDGRNAARQLGLRTRGVVGVLMQAKQSGHITAIRPWLKQLAQTGFHLSPAFVAQVLQEAGE
jgi:uncharacterized protein